MKFSIDQGKLLEPLQKVIGAVERRQTMPVLGNILVEAGNDQLTLTASDSDIELQAVISTPIDDAGVITIPARKFLDICRSLPDTARVDISQDGEQIKCKAGRSRFTLATLPAAEFPKIPPITDGQTVTLPQAKLSQCIKATAFSMALQDVRFYLNGMLMEISQGKLCCVATDGHRLAYAECETDAFPDEPVRAIIPRKSVGEIGRLLQSSTTDDEDEATVELVVSAKHMQATLPGVRMVSKLIDGKFPDYNRVIPIDLDKELLIDREILRQSLSRAAILSNEKYRGVRLSLVKGLLTVSSNNPDQEEAIDEMEVDYAGESADIGFNVTYLLDVLNTLETESASINLKDGNSSALVMPQGSVEKKYVIMPMRL